MFMRCLFCGSPFRKSDDDADALPIGARFAFDPARERVWMICDACHRWNLCLVDERGALLVGLEATLRDRGRLLIHTANIGLFEADGRGVVRIGRASLAEQAWWRYGRRLRDRRLTFGTPTVRLSSLAAGAVSSIGERMGLVQRGPRVGWDDAPLVDALRWWRYGWLAWAGSLPCAFCNSVLRAVLFEDSWWLYPIPGRDGSIAVGVPCPRCDPWTPAKVYRIEGTEAEALLRQVLSYLHVAGAPDRTVEDAANAIEAVGSADAFARHLVSRPASLWKLGPTLSVALEIAVNESAERSFLEDQARGLEVAWKMEDAIARIVDEELTHPPLRLEPRAV